MKKFILALLVILTIYGCGVATKDTTAQTTSPENLLIITDKGISEGNVVSGWTRNIGQSAKTFQGIPQDALKHRPELYLATTIGLYVCTDNLTTFTKVLTANVVNLAELSERVLAATDQGCFISTANRQFELITSANSYQKITAFGQNIYALNKYGIWVATVNVYAWTYVSVNVTENIKDFAFYGGKLTILAGDNVYIDGQPIDLMGEKPERIFTGVGPLLWVSGKGTLYKRGNVGGTLYDISGSNAYDGRNVRNVRDDHRDIYVSAENGVWYSLNGGETWKVLRKQNGILSNNAVKVLGR